MRRKKLVLNGLVVFVCLFLLSTSSVWAVCCIADTTGSPGYPDGLPDGAINAWDYGALKQEWGRSGCVVGDCGGCPYPAPVAKTGQTLCYPSSGPGNPISCTDTGQDGDLREGVEWPNPRFTIIYCNASGPCLDQGYDCDDDDGVWDDDPLTGVDCNDEIPCNFASNCLSYECVGGNTWEVTGADGTPNDPNSFDSTNSM